MQFSNEKFHNVWQWSSIIIKRSLHFNKIHHFIIVILWELHSIVISITWNMTQKEKPKLSCNANYHVPLCFIKKIISSAHLLMSIKSLLFTFKVVRYFFSAHEICRKSREQIQHSKNVNGNIVLRFSLSLFWKFILLQLSHRLFFLLMLNFCRDV